MVNSGIIPNRAFKALGGLEVAYRDSPAVGELKSSIWSAKVTAGHDDEQPNVGDWFAFNRAPSPGERVRDLELASAPSTLARRRRRQGRRGLCRGGCGVAARRWITGSRR